MDEYLGRNDDVAVQAHFFEIHVMDIYIHKIKMEGIYVFTYIPR